MLIKSIFEDTPGVQEVLEAAGIAKKPADGNNLKDILTNNGLSLEEVIQELANVVGSADLNLKKAGIETALKLHKVLDPEQKVVPSVIINIQPLHREQNSAIPSITLPREIEAA